MDNDSFEFPHERDPLFLAAASVYALVVRLELQPGSASHRARLERAASRMALSIQEAIDFPHLRSKRWATAVQSCARATGILNMMRKCEFLGEDAHRRAREELRVVSVRLVPPRRPPVQTSPSVAAEPALDLSGASAVGPAVGGDAPVAVETPPAHRMDEAPPAHVMDDGRPPLLDS